MMTHLRNTLRILSWLAKPRYNDHAEPGSELQQDAWSFTKQTQGYCREPWLELPILPSLFVALLEGPKRDARY